MPRHSRLPFRGTAGAAKWDESANETVFTHSIHRLLSSLGTKFRPTSPIQRAGKLRASH